MGTTGPEHEQDILDMLPDGVVLADASGTVTLVNAAAADLLRTTDAVGRQLAEVVLLQDRAGNTWTSCTRPYDGLASRTRINEQAWYLSDGTELLVTARILREGPRSRSGRSRCRCAPPGPASVWTGSARTWSPPSPTSSARR